MKVIKFKEIFIILILILVTICIYFSGITNDLKSEGTKGLIEISKNIASFNVTFSIGLAALLIAVMSNLQKSQTKDIRKKIIVFINEFILYIFVNFLLLLSTYSGEIWLIHLLLAACIVSTIVIILTARGFVFLFLEKI